ncbi:hypothetical protein PHLGIDRAFT_28037 [Phlebiopsis gigantea 11061_1 CR5-6]|uniref:amidase n=1 Tax=Phlebiopsis gigantea (strain 11061_1 CR5-6) TaxID=745531 RepID=A0A0C3PTZ2_PHLG1|nr:hypothetical protein PHLGIDRAFT_28037 [Phlebiopsis gigantea 11061_1 CR5-6]
MSAGWKSVSERKIADRAALLNEHPDWHLRGGAPPAGVLDVSHLPTSQLSGREREIVHQDATALVHALRERRYSAVEVATAFCRVAAGAQAVCNCLTEVFFAEALQRAAELDAHLAETGCVVGPLHGLPVSIKDHILVRGQDTAAGYTAWAYRTRASRDAVAVDILRRAGAVLYVKTANPQTLLSLETNNNIYGRTLNPFNRNLTPGGSSGGESALISVHGSPLGVGTDIGGSIRIPAGYMGLYGLKGSVARMPHAGLLGSHDGMDAILGALGPIATSARDLALFCRTMLQYEPWRVEPALLELPWRQDIVDGAGIPDRLAVAIMWDDGCVAPHPPILDALKAARDALVAAGHDVVDWAPLDHQEAWELIRKLYFLDGGEEYRATLADDPPVPQTEWILGQVPNGGAPFSVAEIFRLNVAREALRARVLHHWNATAARTASGRPVDAVLSPWDPRTYDNASVSLQLIGRRLNEERVLGMLHKVEAALRASRA